MLQHGLVGGDLPLPHPKPWPATPCFSFKVRAAACIRALHVLVAFPSSTVLGGDDLHASCRQQAVRHSPILFSLPTRCQAEDDGANGFSSTHYWDLVAVEILQMHSLDISPTAVSSLAHHSTVTSVTISQQGLISRSACSLA